MKKRAMFFFLAVIAALSSPAHANDDEFRELTRMFVFVLEETAFAGADQCFAQYKLAILSLEASDKGMSKQEALQDAAGGKEPSDFVREAVEAGYGATGIRDPRIELMYRNCIREVREHLQRRIGETL